MATSGRGTGIVGYNVQTAVDAEHHLIVAHEVINVGHDRAQLEPMAWKAHDAMGCEELTALADRGYFNSEQMLACEATGISPCVPKTVWPHERGLFTRHDFIYDAENNHYPCPAGQKLTRGTRTLRSKGRHRSLPSSDGLLQPFAQAEVYPRQAQEA
jgi:hypothetical protein